MAKSKKSRRARRQEAEKQRQQTSSYQTMMPEVTETSEIPSSIVESIPSTPVAVDPALAIRRKTIDFAQEYFYVYTELRNILIISVLMFGLLVGLSFVI